MGKINESKNMYDAEVFLIRNLIQLDGIRRISGKRLIEEVDIKYEDRRDEIKTYFFRIDLDSLDDRNLKHALKERVGGNYH